MSEDITAQADQRLQEALDASGGRDPRDFYRDRLRELKGRDADKYEAAVEYYRERLIPEVASGAAEPLVAWTEYGRLLAESFTEGHTVRIDGTGKSHPYDVTAIADALLLHLPTGKGRAIVVGLPNELTPAQRATYDVLVAGKQRSRD
jgi:hypothetical protein